MTALAISLDGQRLATVSCDGFDVVAFHLAGTRVDEEVADMHLGASGLIWLDAVQYRPGQYIRVDVLAAGATEPAGQTLQALYPDESDEGDEAAFDFDDQSAIEDLLNGVRQLPARRAAYRFEYASSTGTRASGCTAAALHGITFSAVWNRFHPERVRVSLHAHTLDSVGHRGSEGHVRLAGDELIAGQAVTVSLSEHMDLENSWGDGA